MDKITEALNKIIPEEQVSEVVEAVKEMLAEQVTELETEYQSKLDEAYGQLTEEKQSEETIAEQGYQQAYEVIASLMGRLDEQREEFEKALEEGFEEAYQALQEEKTKNESIEVELYEEFDNKLKEMKEFMVDKVDQFLNLQEAEIYEHAKHDVLTDPQLAENRIVVEKMAGLLSQYIDSDDISAVNSTKIEEAAKATEQLKGQMRIVEARNVKLSAQNNRLNEQVKEANGLLTEAAQIEQKNEKKERASKAKNVSGRGQRVAKDDLIQESNVTTTESSTDSNLSEDAGEQFNDLLVLSGIITD